MLKKLLLISLVVMVALGAFALSACGGQDAATTDNGSAAASNEPIVIGAPMALTGPYAADGTLSKQGVEFAVNELNAAGGVLGRPIKAEYFDIQDMAPERVVLAADTLVGQKHVDAVVAGWAGAGGDVQAFGRYPVPYFMNDGSQAAIDEIQKGGYKNAFQMEDGEPANAKDLFDFSAALAYKYPSKTVMTVGSDDDWGHKMTEGFATAAKSAGWQVVDQEIVPYGTGDWGPIMAKITASKPALLYFEVPSPPDMLTFLRKFKQAPTNTVLNFGYGLQLRDFLTSAGSDADGVIGLTPGMSPPFPASSTAMNDWFKQATDKYGHPLAGVGPQCYSAVKMWAQAVESVGDPTKYDAINEYLATNTFQDVVPGWVPLKFEDYYIHLSTIGSNDGQLQGGSLVTLYNLGQAFTDWQGKETTFQTPSWIK